MGDEMGKDVARRVVHEINRKLTLLRGERKAIKRKEIIDSMLSDEGELKQLKELLGLEE